VKKVNDKIIQVLTVLTTDKVTEIQLNIYLTAKYEIGQSAAGNTFLYSEKADCSKN